MSHGRLQGASMLSLKEVPQERGSMLCSMHVSAARAYSWWKSVSVGIKTSRRKFNIQASGSLWSFRRLSRARLIFGLDLCERSSLLACSRSTKRARESSPKRLKATPPFVPEITLTRSLELFKDYVEMFARLLSTRRSLMYIFLPLQDSVSIRDKRMEK